MNKKVSLADAIERGIFTAREAQALNYFISNSPTLRKPIEAQAWQIPYLPSFIQRVQDRLAIHCGLQFVSRPVHDGTSRKVYSLERVKEAEYE